jgi:hydroxylaminobenzene mutase
MSRSIIRHGFILILIALVSGLFVPAMPIPRLGLSAHTIGILSGVLLIAIGAIWQQFSLPPTQTKVMYWSWLYSSYINWLGCLVGAVLGAGKATPLASAGAVGSEVAEAAVAILLGTVAMASFVAVGLSLWGLRSSESSAT